MRCRINTNCVAAYFVCLSKRIYFHIAGEVLTHVSADLKKGKKYFFGKLSLYYSGTENFEKDC